MKPLTLILATGLCALIATGMGGWLYVRAHGPAAPAAVPAPLRGARALHTAHYTISSTATAAQTAQVGKAVEALHAAFLKHFGLPAASGKRLHLVLYRDRPQFQEHNTGSGRCFHRAPDPCA